MSHLKKTLSAAACAAVVLAATGCQGNADHADHPSRASVPTSFTDRGNDILCEERHGVGTETLHQLLHGEPSDGELRDRFLTRYRAIRDGLGELTPPPTQARAFAQVLSGLDTALAAADRDPSLLDSDADPFGPVEKEMAAIGLDGCA